MDMLGKQIEALLFVSGKPLTYKKIAQITGKPEPTVADYVANLADAYSERGIMIMVDKQSASMVTNPEVGQQVELLTRSDISGELSPAAIETFTVIAYNGPTQKSEIDYIRGVNSAHSLRLLQSRGLIKRELLSKDGQQKSLYSITTEALMHLGLVDQAQMPDFTRVNERLSSFVQESE